MRSDRPMMSSRREILADALGTAFVMGLPSPVSVDESRSRQGQSNTGTSKARRTARKISLTWDVFLAPSIPAITSDLPPGEKQRPWPPISSTLISGERDAVLVDAPITVDRGHLHRSEMFGLHLLFREIIQRMHHDIRWSLPLHPISSSVITFVTVFLLYAFGNNWGTAA
jgi:hypothetical protein